MASMEEALSPSFDNKKSKKDGKEKNQAKRSGSEESIKRR